MILRAVNKGNLFGCLVHDLAANTNQLGQRSIVLSSQSYNQAAHKTKRQDAQKNYSSQYDEIRNRLASSLEQSNSINISDVKNMILLSKREEDLDLSMRALKKAGLKRNETKSAATDLLEQMLYLDKKDKLANLANDQDFQSAVFDHNKNVNLMLGMIKACYEKKDYKQIVELFDSFLSYYPSERLVNLRVAFILYLDMVSEALLEMNNQFAMEKAKHFYDRLKDLNCLKPVPLSNIAYLAIKQNELEFAQSVVDRIRIPFLQINLQILRLLRINQIEEAYQLTEKSLKIKKFVMFSDIHQILEQAIQESKDASLISRMEEMNKNFTPNSLSKKTFEQKLKLMRHEFTSKAEKTPATKKQTSVVQTEPRVQKVNKKQQRSPEAPVPRLDPRLVEYAELFNNKKYMQIISDFESKYLANIGKSSNPRDISTSLVSFVTASLLMLNNPAAFRRLRDMIQILEENQVRISDESKVHVFLLAINQNDPHFALGYSTLTGLDKKSLSMFKNLRVISLCKNKLFNEAFDSANEILDIEVNKFNNEGCFYPLTIECLETASKSGGSRGINSKLDEILTTVRLEDRIANFDLYQFSIDNLKNALVADSIEYQNDDDKSFDINERVHKAYYLSDPMQVLNQFVDHFKNNTNEEIKSETVELIAKSCAQIDIDRQFLIKIVSILRKNNAKMSPASLMELFSVFIKIRNPNGALMLLEKFDEQMSFSSKYPDVYNNCLIIGFGLTLRHRVALEKFKTLLNTPTESNNPFKGKLFPMTIEYLQQSIDRSRNKDIKDQLDELIDRAMAENRVNNLDLCSSLSEF